MPIKVLFKHEGKPVKPQDIDRWLCQHFEVAVDEDRYLGDWYRHTWRLGHMTPEDLAREAQEEGKDGEDMARLWRVIGERYTYQVW